MRRAVITIEWEGPDKAVREFIENRLDGLFEDMTVDIPALSWASSNVQWTSKVKPRG